MTMARLRIVMLLVLPAVALAFLVAAPRFVSGSMNRVMARSPRAVSPDALALHARLLVSDLHADSLLWDRDLAVRSSAGHVDIPRLIEGNVALQAFTVVTKTPRGLNIERNDDQSDMIFWLALVERWPPPTWRSLVERALFQARRLERAAAEARERLVLIRTSSDLKAYLERRVRERDLTAGVLGIEGAHALDGDLANLDRLYSAGFRMMAPTHFFDNDIGGSAHGVEQGGLTPKGREMVRLMEEKGMIVDLAHASRRTIEDVLSVARRSVVVSHTGVKGTCDNPRNLSDDQVRGIAATGGVIGIGYWETAVCGQDAAAIVRALAYAARLAGVDHVGLGSDFDGTTTTPFDTTGLARITEQLLLGGFSEVDIAKIMGGNELGLLERLLP